MTSVLNINTSGILPFIETEGLSSWEEKALYALRDLEQGTGKGADFLGWLHLPSTLQPELFEHIEAIKQDWASDIELVVVIGIGGSYLGAKAVIEALSHPFTYLLDQAGPQIIFAGQNLEEDYLSGLMEVVQHKSTACIVISKSGTTTEPAIAFRLVKQHLYERYGTKEAIRRIVAITDPEKGALRKMAETEGFRTFTIPRDVGGRYSVFTSVGLLPIALAGIAVEELINGAAAMEKITAEENRENPAIQYAAARNALYAAGKKIELLVTYHPGLFFLAEWWKQLFGESEGKEHKGLFPAGVSFTTDLHSMGQYIQDGERHLFETAITIEEPLGKAVIPHTDRDDDGLNYLAGKRIDYCNKMAASGTRLAHIDGGVPNLAVQVPRLTPFYLGALLYFFQKGCGISGYVLGVNPFDQEGVEAYKKNMFALLNKPGFEAQGELLRKRL
ncbi:MAG: glucose-6-phosphate isomerase [Bacteroidales bacterium]